MDFFHAQKVFFNAIFNGEKVGRAKKSKYLYSVMSWENVQCL